MATTDELPLPPGARVWVACDHPLIGGRLAVPATFRKESPLEGYLVVGVEGEGDVSLLWVPRARVFREKGEAEEEGRVLALDALTTLLQDAKKLIRLIDGGRREGKDE